MVAKRTIQRPFLYSSSHRRQRVMGSPSRLDSVSVAGRSGVPGILAVHDVLNDHDMREAAIYSVVF